MRKLRLMAVIFFYLCLHLLFFTNNSITFAKEITSKNFNSNQQITKYKYSYINTEHSLQNKFIQITALYGVSWLAYRLTQPSAFKKKSKEKYFDNLGKMAFDYDGPRWNWVVHSLSGSQLFLFYRAMGHSRSSALGMSFISTALFEYTIEIYSEPASIQDLYQTPIFGSILGLGIEHLSMYLLNTNTIIGKLFGHLINPATLLWFYEGKLKIIPQYNGNNNGKITLLAEF